MAEAAFNTIAEIQRLRDAGLPQEQAEAITLSIHSGVTGGVATKADLEQVEERLGSEIKLVHKDIDLVRKDVQALDTKIDTGLAALDTKIDLVKEGLETKIDASVKMLETKIESASRNTIIWLGGALFVGAIALNLMDRYFPPPG